MEHIDNIATWAQSGRTITRRKRNSRVRLAYGVWAQIQPGAPWEIWEAVQKERARRVLNMSADGTALDGSIAALMYGAPIPHKTWEIELITGVKHSRHHAKCKLRFVGEATYQWVGSALGLLPATTPQNSSATSVEVPSATHGQNLPRIHEGVVKRSSRTLPTDAYTTIDGLKTLKWDYLCVELLARHPAPHCVPIVDWFIQQRVLEHKRDRAAVEATFRNILLRFETILASRKDHRGKRRARHNLRLISPWSESVGESLLRLELHRFGFPPATEQFEIGEGGRRYFTDFAYPSKGLALEFDGIVKYDGTIMNPEIALHEERQREETIRRKLPNLERFTWGEFKSGSLSTRLAKLRSRYFPGAMMRRLI